MPINSDEILNVCQILSETENLKVTITEVLKGVGIVGVATLAGGLLGGARGILLGGVLGSIAAALIGKGKYKSVTDILRNELSAEQKQRLADSVSAVVKNVHVEDAAALSTIALGNSTIKDAIVREIGNFLQKEMGLAMVNP